MNPIPRTGQITAKVAVWLALLLALPVSIARAQSEPAARLLPGATERVIAVALRDAAIIAWLLPETSTDAPPITGYTISAFDNDTPNIVAATAKARAAGTLVHRLVGGHCYTFSVHASNTVGNGPESERSEPICLPATVADITLAMSSPSSSSPGSEVTFTITVSNYGPENAALVTLIDLLPAPLARFTTSQGVCQGVAGGISFGCNLGSVPSGEHATITVTVVVGNTGITNTGWATAYDAAGAALADPVQSNNTASATVTVQP